MPNSPEEAFRLLEEKGIVKELLRHFDDVLSDAIVEHLDYIDDDEEHSDTQNEDRYVEVWLRVMREFRMQFLPPETWGELHTTFPTYGVDMNTR